MKQPGLFRRGFAADFLSNVPGIPIVVPQRALLICPALPECFTLALAEAFVRDISAAALAALALVTLMPYEMTYCGRLWTLRRNGQIARAEVIQGEGAGLELRYTRNDKPFVRRMFTDGADLLRAAAVERFELERDGWSLSPRANAPTRQIQT